LAAAAQTELAQPEFGPPCTSARSKDAEFGLLLTCCRGEHSKCGQAIPFTRWERFFNLADHHRVLPAVYLALYDCGDVSPLVRDQIRTRFQKHVRQSLRLSAELAGILRKFGEYGIEALPHKGAVLAQGLFGDPAMRQFGDLDLLVRTPDVTRARAALQELGYQPNLTLSHRQENEYLRVGNEYVFGCDQGKNLVELQWQILPRFYSVPFDMDALFSRSVETEFEGERVQVLGNEDLMLVLCAHAAKHQWEHLGMVRDIARLARFDLDWKWIEAEARRLGIFRILMISLLLARNLLRCELPEHLRPDVNRDKECNKLAGAAELRLRSGSYSKPESLSYFRSMAALRERRRDRVLLGWRLVATPNVGEWESVAIPDCFSSLYRGVRVARLIRRIFG
jgi:hypothetical protein